MLAIRELNYVLSNPPSACATISGSASNANITGLANFYQINSGILLFIRVKGLPISVQPCGPSFFGMHIHEGSTCTGTDTDPFAGAGAHYNPMHCDHPGHSGDLPPLTGNHGEAFMIVLTSSFSIEEIIGRTLIIHASPDDFKTQPSGASGGKIACGQITQNGCSANNIAFN